MTVARVCIALRGELRIATPKRRAGNRDGCEATRFGQSGRLT
jgi:hypothetical protein